MGRLAIAEQQQSYAGLSSTSVTAAFPVMLFGSRSTESGCRSASSNWMGRLPKFCWSMDRCSAPPMSWRLRCARRRRGTVSVWTPRHFPNGTNSVRSVTRVAGRSAVALAVVPRDQHRYGFELHLDRETALPLKSLMLNEKGQLLERFQYAQFSTGPIDAQQLKPSADCKPVSVSKREANPSSVWRSDWLPAGFVA